jgi:hypothetical protein
LKGVEAILIYPLSSIEIFSNEIEIFEIEKKRDINRKKRDRKKKSKDRNFHVLLTHKFGYLYQENIIYGMFDINRFLRWNLLIS